jgi:hypothetical protein
VGLFTFLTKKIKILFSLFNSDFPQAKQCKKKEKVDACVLSWCCILEASQNLEKG